MVKGMESGFYLRPWVETEQSDLPIKLELYILLCLPFRVSTAVNYLARRLPLRRLTHLQTC